MSLSIGGVPSSANLRTSGPNRPDPATFAAKIASKIVQEFDSNQDGSLDKKEFVAGLTTKGISAEEASKQFDAIDTKKTGSINQADLEAAIKSGKIKPPAGRRPAGGDNDGDNDRSGAAAQKTYAPADTNQDGTVSAQEALAYTISQQPNSQQSKVSLTKVDVPQTGTTIDVKA